MNDFVEVFRSRHVCNCSRTVFLFNFVKYHMPNFMRLFEVMWVPRCGDEKVMKRFSFECRGWMCLRAALAIIPPREYPTMLICYILLIEHDIYLLISRATISAIS